MIKGITVTLIKQIESGKDEFGAPIYEERRINVDNVLVAPSTTTEILDTTNLYGKKAVYSLGIPKDDTNVWEDQIVEFFGQKWRVFGFTTIGIESMIPLSWNRKAMVEKYG